MSLENKYIFFLGTTRFDGTDQSTSYTIARQLARDNHVFYIDYPFTWKDYFRLKGSAQVIARKPYFPSSSDGIVSTGIPNFKVIITPLLLSLNFLPEGPIYRWLLKLNEGLVRRRLKKVIKKLNISEFVYFNSFNFHYPGIADSLKPALNVYQCVDPMIIPYDMKHGITSESQLVAKSDLIICTSKQLYLEKKEQNPNTFFVPNAADVVQSSKSLDENLEIDPRIAGIQKPIIGYIGTIERRINYPMIKTVAERNPKKSFVFIGPQSPEFVPEWFKEIPNVHLLSAILYEEIPAFMKAFDIAIIPFKKDEVSSTIFPLKLFEYLGAGKPVIATNFNPDLEEFTKGNVAFCEDADSFSDAINDILKNDSTEKLRSRLALAQENTWEMRARDISELIDKNLQNKKLSWR